MCKIENFLEANQMIAAAAEEHYITYLKEIFTDLISVYQLC